MQLWKHMECMLVCSVTQSCLLFLTLWIGACRAPLSMGFSRQNTAVGCHFLLKGSSRPRNWICVSCSSCHCQVDSLPLSHHGSSNTWSIYHKTWLRDRRFRISLAILKKKNKVRWLRLPDIKSYYEATIRRTMWFWQKE